jgi:cellulose synthase/poly-beta-1,6-N-acetylglucosamine synthase-like glycosyltransferase
MLALALFVFVLLLDVQNAAARWRAVLRPADEPSDDYTILVPLYGDPRYFRNRRGLEAYRDRVALVVRLGPPSMSQFAAEAERDGWRVIRCERGASPPELLREALPAVATSWVIRVDGDTEFTVDPGRAVAAAAAADADVCSVKIVPTSTRTLAERLQALEYAMAMLGRHHRPWLTSGACFAARTDALAEILDRHSGWFLGEDIEVGVIARRLRMRIRHLDFPAFTEVPSDFVSLARQRRGWWAGCFRQTWVNGDHGLHEPLTLLYSAALVWLLFVGKVVTLDGAFRRLPLLIVLYTALTTLANWQIRNRWLVFYPYYALAQAIVMPPLGVVHYVRTAVERRSLGRYRIPLRRQRLTTSRSARFDRSP